MFHVRMLLHERRMLSRLLLCCVCWCHRLLMLFSIWIAIVNLCLISFVQSLLLLIMESQYSKPMTFSITSLLILNFVAIWVCLQTLLFTWAFSSGTTFLLPSDFFCWSTLAKCFFCHESRTGQYTWNVLGLPQLVLVGLLSLARFSFSVCQSLGRLVRCALVWLECSIVEYDSLLGPFSSGVLLAQNVL